MNGRPPGGFAQPRRPPPPVHTRSPSPTAVRAARTSPSALLRSWESPPRIIVPFALVATVRDSEPDERTLRGVEMDRDEVDEFHAEQGAGVLSLARENEAYGVPISFGYDGDRRYVFVVRFGEDSETLDCADATERASSAMYDFPDEHRWRSVVVRGTLEPVPEGDLDAADEALFGNARFANLSPYGEPMTERPRYQLTVEEATGQKGQGLDV